MFYKPIIRHRRTLIAVFLILLGLGVYAVSLPAINQVTIDNLSSVEVKEVKMEAGINTIYIDTLWPGYEYQYSFVSPGDGVLKFEGTFDGRKLVCEAGYITPESASTTKIVVLEEGRIEMFFTHGRFSSATPVLCSPHH